MGHYNDNENKLSNQCDRSNDVTWVKVEDESGAGILVDDVSRGGSNGSQNSKRSLTVKELLLSQEDGRKSDKSDPTGVATVTATADPVLESNQRAQSNEMNRHTEDEEVGEEIHVDGFGSEKSGDISLIFSGYKVEVGEENVHSIQRAQMSQHKKEEEMGKEIIVNDISSGGSKGTSKLMSGLTFKKRLLSQLGDKKLDEGDPTAAYVTPSVAPAHKDKLRAISKAQKEEDDSASVHPFVQECDEVLSVDHENIKVSDSNETDRIGLEINVIEPLAALNITGKKSEAVKVATDCLVNGTIAGSGERRRRRRDAMHADDGDGHHRMEKRRLSYERGFIRRFRAAIIQSSMSRPFGFIHKKRARDEICISPSL